MRSACLEFASSHPRHTACKKLGATVIAERCHLSARFCSGWLSSLEVRALGRPARALESTRWPGAFIAVQCDMQAQYHGETCCKDYSACSGCLSACLGGACLGGACLGGACLGGAHLGRACLGGACLGTQARSALGASTPDPIATHSYVVLDRSTGADHISML